MSNKNENKKSSLWHKGVLVLCIDLPSLRALFLLCWVNPLLPLLTALQHSSIDQSERPECKQHTN